MMRDTTYNTELGLVNRVARSCGGANASSESLDEERSNVLVGFSTVALGKAE